MKISNCVVGQVIEAKRDAVGINASVIPKGLHVLVGKVQLPSIDNYPVRVDHDSFTGGYEWVNPADFRKVQEVVQVDAVPDDVQKGTKVICVRGFVEPRFSDYFKEGVVYVVQKGGLDLDGELNLEHPSLGGGHGYGKPQHFRLYKEPQTEECTPQNLRVGDTVLVGAHGAGYRHVLPEYAGLTCTVVHIPADASVYIQHPNVRSGSPYRSWLKYLTKVIKEPVVEPEPVVQEFQEGDVLECITDCEGKHNEKCVAGRLYKYDTDSRWHTGRIKVQDPQLWMGDASVLPENFKLYARPVKDSTDADVPTA